MGTAAAVLAICVVSLALSWLAAPADPTGYGARAEKIIVDACTRARGGEGGDGCRCAYQALERSLPWDRAVEVDRQLGRGERLDPEVESLVAPCWDLASPS